MKARKPHICLLAIATTVAMFATACGEHRQVDRTVELHYINGEVETRTFRGSVLYEPHLTDGYTPSYYDGYNLVRCVVRFRVLRADTLEQKGGSK